MAKKHLSKKAKARAKAKAKLLKAAGPSSAEILRKKKAAALEYLSGWRARSSGGGWRFNKKLQWWWTQNALKPEVIKKEELARFLEYAPTMSGGVADRLVDEARQAAKRADELLESEATGEDAKERRQAQKIQVRARRLIKAMAIEEEVAEFGAQTRSVGVPVNIAVSGVSRVCVKGTPADNAVMSA
eukprot:CAMPEP_0194507424 /NCGR_PEP_ID=MMETSP0253-20130528/36981_1 /TAXON_ID=2966 /ORGANISM="Noctiluca scintillans" /LENGTH=186 /DNA_ID=CAMNT_0039350325 /DNA_START=33 /DNA_END=591 /DNA_ORIENTATION=+